jgi:hypothetical protein
LPYINAFQFDQIDDKQSNTESFRSPAHFVLLKIPFILHGIYDSRRKGGVPAQYPIYPNMGVKNDHFVQFQSSTEVAGAIISPRTLPLPAIRGEASCLILTGATFSLERTVTAIRASSTCGQSPIYFICP